MSHPDKPRHGTSIFTVFFIAGLINALALFGLSSFNFYVSTDVWTAFQQDTEATLTQSLQLLKNELSTHAQKSQLDQISNNIKLNENQVHKLTQNMKSVKLDDINLKIKDLRDSIDAIIQKTKDDIIAEFAGSKLKQSEQLEGMRKSFESRLEGVNMASLEKSLENIESQQDAVLLGIEKVKKAQAKLAGEVSGLDQSQKKIDAEFEQRVSSLNTEIQSLQKSFVEAEQKTEKAGDFTEWHENSGKHFESNIIELKTTKTQNSDNISKLQSSFKDFQEANLNFKIVSEAASKAHKSDTAQMKQLEEKVDRSLGRIPENSRFIDELRETLLMTKNRVVSFELRMKTFFQLLFKK